MESDRNGTIKCRTLEKVRQKKKLSPEELHFISLVAKEELKFLARNNIPLIPENYILWFEIFCYLLENKLKLSDLEIIGLFKTKYPTVQKIENILLDVEKEDREVLQQIANSISAEIDSLVATLKEHVESLKDRESSVREIKESIEDQTVKGMLAKVIEELQEIRRQNESLKKKLEESNEQIKKLSQELENTRKEATTDFLTRVANRARFDKALSDMVRDFNKRNYPFALLLIDIDNFKRINDTYGHQAGDYVLQELAKVIKEQLNARDLVARYGGEEFAILLPGVTFSQAVRVAEGVRRAVEKHLFKYHGTEIPVTVSIGVAVMREGLDETLLIEKADKALYLAKRLGKNQVRTDLDVELEG